MIVTKNSIKMIVAEVETSGIYIHVGFMVAGKPVQEKNEDGSIKSITGVSYLLFKKDSSYYYVENNSFSGIEPKKPYGSFQDYLTPNYINKKFSLDVVEKVVTANIINEITILQ